MLLQQRGNHLYSIPFVIILQAHQNNTMVRLTTSENQFTKNFVIRHNNSFCRYSLLQDSGIFSLRPNISHNDNIMSL